MIKEKEERIVYYETSDGKRSTNKNEAMAMEFCLQLEKQNLLMGMQWCGNVVEHFDKVLMAMLEVKGDGDVIAGMKKRLTIAKLILNKVNSSTGIPSMYDKEYAEFERLTNEADGHPVVEN